MIDFIRGKLAENGNGWVVIENNGMGFRIDVPLTMNALGWTEGENVTVYTKLVIKEDGLYLYGFPNNEERRLFNLITGVSGFGPKVALSILGIISVSRFYIAILDEDVKMLCEIPGIGKKSAQRLILELKEKLPAVFPEVQKGTGTTIKTPLISDPREEASKALCSLGYSRSEAFNIVEATCSEIKVNTTEEIVKAALKKMSSR